MKRHTKRTIPGPAELRAKRKPLSEEMRQFSSGLKKGKMKRGASVQRFQSTLVERGIDPESAATTVSNITRRVSEGLRENGGMFMSFGVYYCTVAINLDRSPPSVPWYVRTSLVAVGALIIVYGAIKFVRGLILSRGG